MVTCCKFKRKEQHEIKWPATRDTKVREIVNANPALYPTGFTCYAFSKGPPVKAHTGYGTLYTLPSLRDSSNLARALYAILIQKSTGILWKQLFHKHLLRTSFQGLRSRGTRSGTKILLGAGILWSNKSRYQVSSSLVHNWQSSALRIKKNVNGSSPSTVTPKSQRHLQKFQTEEI